MTVPMTELLDWSLALVPVLLMVCLFVWLDMFKLMSLGEMLVLLLKENDVAMHVSVVDPRKVSLSLYGKYIIAVELAGFLLMAGIVGAAHIGKHTKRNLHRFLQENGSGKMEFTVEPEVSGKEELTP